MIKKVMLFIIPVFLTAACDRKKESIGITKDNVKEVLTAYGRENPENEVVMETEFGIMKIRLYEDTPLHRANFIKMIKEGVYEDAEFYRIFFQFMIQGGIYLKEFNYTIPAEFNKKYIHKKGALSMAQSEDNNPNHESSASEFFIVHGSVYTDYQVDNEESNNHLQLTPEQKQKYMSDGGYMSLDQQYTTFGEVTEGLDVIDRIAGVKVFEQDKPLKKIPVKITVTVK
jgi:cyclophilin family peptidyl-prolyl cis-trans isomerase